MIDAEAFIVIRWLESEFKSLDHRLAAWVLQDLDDFGLEWINADGYPTFARSGDEMVMHLPMNVQHIMKDEVMYDVEMFEHFASKAAK